MSNSSIWIPKGEPGDQGPIGPPGPMGPPGEIGDGLYWKVRSTVAKVRLIVTAGVAEMYVQTSSFGALGDGSPVLYYLDKTDTTSVDDNATVIVTGDGGRFKLADKRQVDIRTFGAIPDCTGTGLGTDNYAAIQKAINYAVARGFTVYIPSGKYRVSQALVFNSSASADLFQGFRGSIRGEGPRQSQLYFDNGNYDGLTLLGGSTLAGSPSWQTVEGLGLIKNDRVGSGLVLNSHFHAQVNNMLILGFAVGHTAIDVHEHKYDNMVIQFCDAGARWQKGTLTQPNIITLLNCTVGNCANYGIDVINPATFTWVGGSIESNGTGGSATDKWGARIIINNSTSEGSVAATFNGAYFENNVGLSGGVLGNADIVYSNSAAPASLVLIGNSFQRHVARGKNCVSVSTSGNFKNALVLIGNGFRGYFDYTPSASTPYVQIYTPTQPIKLVDIGNIYADNLEAPTYAMGGVVEKAVAAAWARFDGTVATPTITQSHNIAGIVKNGTGDYTITYSRPMTQAENCYTYSFVGANGVLQIFGETVNSVQIKTVNLSGVATDFRMSLHIAGAQA